MQLARGARPAVRSGKGESNRAEHESCPIPAIFQHGICMVFESGQERLTGVSAFHNRTVLSPLTVARWCPSGLNATSATSAVCPMRGSCTLRPVTACPTIRCRRRAAGRRTGVR